MKVGSLFSGIGGIDLGLQWAGMETIWFVEYEKYCQKILAKNFPGVPIYGDIKEIDFTTLSRPDLLCGGFPCQPYSFAGRRRGKEDSRNLWPDTFKAICQIRPRWLLLENVPGLLVHEYFGEILGQLASCGYVAEWDCLPASAFGAPHRRDRLWIVAYSTIIRSPRQTNQQKSKYQKVEWSQQSCGDGKAWNASYSNNLWKLQPKGSEQNKRGWISNYSKKNIFNSNVPRREKQRQYIANQAKYTAIERSDWWITEPGVCGVADGVPNRVDRIKALGNAVVPQCAEYIGKLIMERHYDL